MNDEFSVYQFFKDDLGYECVGQHVSSEAAVRLFKRFTNSVAAQMGVVIRVIITDDGDFCNMEWKFGEGVTFPVMGKRSG